MFGNSWWFHWESERWFSEAAKKKKITTTKKKNIRILWIKINWMNESWNKIYRLFSFKCVYFYIKFISTFSCNFSIKKKKHKNLKCRNLEEQQRTFQTFTKTIQSMYFLSFFFHIAITSIESLKYHSTVKLSNTHTHRLQYYKWWINLLMARENKLTHFFLVADDWIWNC